MNHEIMCCFKQTNKSNRFCPAAFEKAAFINSIWGVNFPIPLKTLKIIFNIFANLMDEQWHFTAKAEHFY